MAIELQGHKGFNSHSPIIRHHHRKINSGSVVLDPVIPWYYYVPREGIESERSEPNSVRRLPASKSIE